MRLIHDRPASPRRGVRAKPAEDEIWGINSQNPAGRPGFGFAPDLRRSRAASCTRSVAVVTVWGIAISIVARIEATIPTVKTAAVPAVKAAAAKPAAINTPAVKTSAKAVGLGSTNADRGGERDSDNGDSHQQLAGHVTLLFKFRIRLRHRMLERYAGTRLACLAKKRCLACWNTAPLFVGKTSPLLLVPLQVP